MSLSIIIPTIGRPSLRRTLLSLMPQCTQQDQIIVVADGDQPNGHTFCLEARAQFLNVHIEYHETEPLHNWGHHQRQHGLTMATEAHIMSIDDDDIYVPGALDVI